MTATTEKSDLPISRAELVNACTACQSHQLHDFLTVFYLPVHVGLFYSDPDAARQANMGTVQLAWCQNCSHVFNRRFDERLLCYQPGYEVALHYSSIFRDYIQELAARLVADFELTHHSILEIGAGDGFFLKLLGELGAIRGWGIDPTILQRQTYRFGVRELELIPGWFDSELACELAGNSPDVVCSLSVLEHISKPQQFVQQLRTMIGDRSVGYYFEIFNAGRAFQQQEIWSIHYEQCNYFCQQSLGRLFVENGFEVKRLGTCYAGDQYLFIEGRSSTSNAVSLDASHSAIWANHRPHHEVGLRGENLPAAITGFSSEFQERLEWWTRTLDEYTCDNRKVIFWGAAGKGISFLNLVPNTDCIRYVVETNPNKQGKYVPGTGHPIVSPQHLLVDPPSLVIVSNALYKSEIQDQVGQLGLTSEFLVA